MIFRKTSPAFLAAFVALSAAVLAPSISSATGRLLQVGTLSALSAGVYDGYSTLEPLQRPNAFGLGTFDKLDGEMVVLDGVAYRIGSDGKVTKPVNSTKIPFAAVSVIAEPDVTFDVGAVASKADLEKLILSKLSSVNYPVLIVINAHLDAIRTRSVPAQQKPYEPLADVCATQQKEFELGAQDGTLVGFYCPQYMSGLNAPGFHLHFLNDDHSAGGHVLSLAIKSGRARLQILTSVLDILPGTDSAFAESDIAPAKPAEKVKGE
jgi:acetolactate decarboxylase